MYLLNASKSYYNSHKAIQPRKKKYRFIYFYDQDGHIHRSRVSLLQYFFKKYFCKKAHQRVCLACHSKYCTYEKISLLCGSCTE